MDAWPIENVQIDDEITLRRFERGDADKVYEAVCRNVDHLMEFMHWMVPEYSRDMAGDFVERSIKDAEARASISLGIFRDDSLIGSIGLASFDWPSQAAEIGYWIDKAEEGRGIVSRACKILIDHAFDDLGLNRIQIRCAAENTRSSALPKRFGFKLEGCLRQSQFRNNKLHDFLVFGLLASERPVSGGRKKL